MQAHPSLIGGEIGAEILARKEELGTLLAREEGKTKAEGIGEAARAGYLVKPFAGECVRLAGEVVRSVRPGIRVEITREPVGVIGIITPWNFPIAIPACRRGLPRAVRRPQGLELRTARAGALRRRVLYDRQDRVRQPAM